LNVTLLGTLSKVYRQWEFRKGRLGSVTNARREFWSHLNDRCEKPSDPDAAALIFGELVANAMKYGREPIVAWVDYGQSHAMLYVEDSGDCFSLTQVGSAGPQQIGGRGIQIASCLARSLRIDHLAGSRCRVTVELPARFASEERAERA